MVLNIDFFRPSDDPDAIGPDQVRRMLAIPTRIQERHTRCAHTHEFTFLSWAVWSPPTRVSLMGLPFPLVVAWPHGSSTPPWHRHSHEAPAHRAWLPCVTVYVCVCVTFVKGCVGRMCYAGSGPLCSSWPRSSRVSAAPVRVVVTSHTAARSLLQLREAQRKRFKDPAIIDNVIAADEAWRQCEFLHRSADTPTRLVLRQGCR